MLSKKITQNHQNLQRGSDQSELMKLKKKKTRIFCLSVKSIYDIYWCRNLECKNFKLWYIIVN